MKNDLPPAWLFEISLTINCELTWHGLIVMELMKCNLTVFLENYQNVSMFVKLSILQDVYRGVNYLHNQSFIHQNLHSNNVALTSSLEAKICDSISMKVMPLQSRYVLAEKLLKTVDFLSPEILKVNSFLQWKAIRCVLFWLCSLSCGDPKMAKSNCCK